MSFNEAGVRNPVDTLRLSDCDQRRPVTNGYRSTPTHGRRMFSALANGASDLGRSLERQEYRLDGAHPQRCTFRTDARQGETYSTLCDVRLMDEAPHERLQKARARAGFEDATAAARAYGWNENTYRSHENGMRGLRSDPARRYARAFRTSAAWLLTGEGSIDNADLEAVPIVGKAGAGPNATVLFAENDGNFGFIKAPLGATPQSKAIEVVGSSMVGIALDGWAVVIDEVRDEVTPDMLGEPCVVWLEDDQVLLKILRPGREKGTYDLESQNAVFATLRDQRVKRAALVTEVITKRGLQRLEIEPEGEARV